MSLLVFVLLLLRPLSETVKTQRCCWSRFVFLSCFFVNLFFSFWSALLGWYDGMEHDDGVVVEPTAGSLQWEVLPSASVYVWRLMSNSRHNMSCSRTARVVCCSRDTDTGRCWGWSARQLHRSVNRMWETAGTRKGFHPKHQWFSMMGMSFVFSWQKWRKRSTW